MSKSEFTMLAHVYKPEKINPSGYFVSEKLDGIRCIFDGGFTRGLPCAQIPFANTAKDSRYVNAPVSTGLWSRYGNVINAPSWFVDGLPSGVPLDGELYLHRGGFQDLISTVKRLEPDERWKDITYRIFDSPSYYSLFGDRIINTINFKINLNGVWRWVRSHIDDLTRPMIFEQSLDMMSKLVLPKHAIIQPQERLPFGTTIAKDRLYEKLEEVTLGGGEGLVLRKPSSYWTPERSHSLLKVKKLQDAEAVVVGYTAGLGKYLGLMGSLRVRYNNVEFDLSGFTDLEREMSSIDSNMLASDYLSSIAGCVVKDNRIINNNFPIGSVVTFAFRELSDNLIPKEARYLRRR